VQWQQVELIKGPKSSGESGQSEERDFFGTFGDFGAEISAKSAESWPENGG
jgi:hypothetical protein